MTPAPLVQTQQMLPVLPCAKSLQEQHLAEVFHRLLDQISIVGGIPAAETATCNTEGASLAYRGNADLMGWLSSQHVMCFSHTKCSLAHAALHITAMLRNTIFHLALRKLGQLHDTEPVPRWQHALAAHAMAAYSAATHLWR